MKTENKICVIFILLFLTTLLFSCAAPEPAYPPETAEIEWHTKTPEQVLNRLHYDQEEITTLTAAFSLSIDPPPEGQPSHMRGVLFFAKKPGGPCVRIKGLGPFGKILFDLVQKRDSLQIYIPSQKILYQGQTDTGGVQQNIWGEMLKTAFFQLTEATAAKGVPLTFEENMVVVPLSDGKLLLDRGNGLLLKRYSEDKIIVYDRYNQNPGHYPFPTHIEITTTDNNRHAVCKLSHTNLNSDISDVFDLSAYNPDHVRELEKLDF
jgi:hypothetical protein